MASSESAPCAGTFKTNSRSNSAGPINTLDQVFSDPQVIHRGVKLNLPSAAAKGGTIPGVRTPLVIGGRPMAHERPSPRLGEHTEEILREIGE